MLDRASLLPAGCVDTTNRHKGLIMTSASIKGLTVAVAATAFFAGSALAGTMCGGQSHEVSVPTETVSTETDGPMTVVETTTQEVR